MKEQAKIQECEKCGKRVSRKRSSVYYEKDGILYDQSIKNLESEEEKKRRREKNSEMMGKIRKNWDGK